MYKVEAYKFTSESTENFVKGNVYYLRRNKRGDCEFLTTEKVGYELLVNSGKMSLASNYNMNYVSENFEKIGSKYYKNYTEFTKKE